MSHGHYKDVYDVSTSSHHPIKDCITYLRMNLVCACAAIFFKFQTHDAANNSLWKLSQVLLLEFLASMLKVKGAAGKGGGKTRSKGTADSTVLSSKKMIASETDYLATLRNALRNENGGDKDVLAELVSAFRCS